MTPTAPMPAGRASGTSACGHVPTAHLLTPVAIITYMTPTKAYVGIAKSIPDSRTPRRFATRQQEDEAKGDRDLVALEPGGRGSERNDPGGDRDGHGEDVVD